MVIARSPTQYPPRGDGPYINRLFGTARGADVFVVGTGTSLTGFKWEILSGKIVVALNDAILSLPLATVHLFADINIWNRYVAHSYDPSTVIVCQRAARSAFLKGGFKHLAQVHTYDQVGEPNMAADDDGLYVNRTVATAGITLAWKLGAERIFLLGIDAFKIRVPTPDGGSREVYYHDGRNKGVERHRKDIRVKGQKVTQDRHDFWIKQMRALRDYFKAQRVYPGPWPCGGVYNLSPESEIDAWQKVLPGEVLGDCFEKEARTS